MKINDAKREMLYFKESQVWRVLLETVFGLRAMHKMGVMHRDIKSANIFLFTPQTQETTEINSQSQTDLLQQAKLGDMNVSKVSKQGMNRTQTGTPYYASPEVWRDEPYSFKSDIWSLGVVIYEMTSLIPPFQAKDMQELFKKV